LEIKYFQGLDFFLLWVSLGKIGYLLLLAGKVWVKSNKKPKDVFKWSIHVNRAIILILPKGR